MIPEILITEEAVLHGTKMVLKVKKNGTSIVRLFAGDNEIMSIPASDIAPFVQALLKIEDQIGKSEEILRIASCADSAINPN